MICTTVDDQPMHVDIIKLIASSSRCIEHHKGAKQERAQGIAGTHEEGGAGGDANE